MMGTEILFLPAAIFTSSASDTYYCSRAGNWWQIQVYERLGYIGRRRPIKPAIDLAPGYALSPSLAEACSAIERLEYDETH